MSLGLAFSCTNDVGERLKYEKKKKKTIAADLSWMSWSLACVNAALAPD
jgi:hypothetical protein